MLPDAPLPTETSLENLQALIAPQEIAYFDLSGALPIRAMRVCEIIKGVDDAAILKTLLAHSKTLHAPRGKEFPIERVRRAIVCRLADLDILTSQNG